MSSGQSKIFLRERRRREKLSRSGFVWGTALRKSRPPGSPAGNLGKQSDCPKIVARKPKENKQTEGGDGPFAKEKMSSI